MSLTPKERERIRQTAIRQLQDEGSYGDKVTKPSLIAPWPTKRHPINRVGRAKA
jgi:hypothetical protein